MREDPPAADDEIELQHVHERLPRRLLLEHVGNGPLLLDSLQPGRQRFVMDEGQTQGLARDGLLDLALIQSLRYRRRADDLVLCPVAQVLLVDREGYPSHDAVES